MQLVVLWLYKLHPRILRYPFTKGFFLYIDLVLVFSSHKYAFILGVCLTSVFLRGGSSLES